MSAAGWKAAVVTRNLSVTLGDNELFSGLDINIPLEKVTSIIGPNGAGKTTLLLAIMGLVKYSGTIDFFKPRKELRIGYVPQKLSIPPDSAVSVMDLFAVQLQKMPVFLGYTRACKETASRLLGQVGMDRYRHHRISSLSGGELQRVLLAAALAQAPDILILDEPAAGVDVKGGLIFDDLIRDVNARTRMSVIMVSHDLNAVNKNSDHVICLNRKMVCEGPPEKALTADSINHAFGDPAYYHHHEDGDGSHG